LLKNPQLNCKLNTGHIHKVKHPTTKKTVVPTPVFRVWSLLSKAGRLAASRFLLCAFPFEYVVVALTFFFFLAREEDMPWWHLRFSVWLHALAVHRLRHA
jgi:hypothetical protein